MKIDIENVMKQLRTTGEAKIDVEIEPELEARITLTEPPTYEAKIEVKRAKINKEEIKQKCEKTTNPGICELLYIALISEASVLFKHRMETTINHEKQTLKIETMIGIIDEDNSYTATDMIKITFTEPLKELNPERYEKLIHQLITITPIIEELYRKAYKIIEATI